VPERGPTLKHVTEELVALLLCVRSSDLERLIWPSCKVSGKVLTLSDFSCNPDSCLYVSTRISVLALPQPC
jgi:hypothetical protein